jgi:hypothetical protein
MAKVDLRTLVEPAVIAMMAVAVDAADYSMARLKRPGP